jgi:hypothetical protein
MPAIDRDLAGDEQGSPVVAIVDDLEQFLDEYLAAAGIRDHDKTPLFRSAAGRTGILTDRPMHRVDAYETMRRRTAEAGFKWKLGCHVFRATGITAYLEAGGTLENAQAMAAHESPRTTKLYDRTGARSRSMKSSRSIFSSQSPLAPPTKRCEGSAPLLTAICMRCGA